MHHETGEGASQISISRRKEGARLRELPAAQEEMRQKKPLFELCSGNQVLA
jgi:hypothetical protein